MKKTIIIDDIEETGNDTLFVALVLLILIALVTLLINFFNKIDK